VLSELEFALRQKERTLQSNPYDTVAQNHIGILSQVRLTTDLSLFFLITKQLRKLVEAGVSQDELAQILVQLRALVRPTSANVTPPSALPTSKYTSAVSYPPSFMYNQTVVPPAGTPLVHPQCSQAHAPAYPNSAQQFQTSDTSKPLNPVVPSSAPRAIPNITGLFEALVKAGVVSATSTPTGAGATAQVPDDTQTQPRDVQTPTESNLEDARAYRKAILAEDVRFSSAEISRYSVHPVSS
jgi:pre-mRNA cleavage complex 2 protein Pcf11